MKHLNGKKNHKETDVAVARPDRASLPCPARIQQQKNKYYLPGHANPTRLGDLIFPVYLNTGRATPPGTIGRSPFPSFSSNSKY